MNLGDLIEAGAGALGAAAQESLWQRLREAEARAKRSDLAFRREVLRMHTVKITASNRIRDGKLEEADEILVKEVDRWADFDTDEKEILDLREELLDLHDSILGEDEGEDEEGS